MNIKSIFVVGNSLVNNTLYILLALWISLCVWTATVANAETIYPTAEELGIAQFDTDEFRIKEFVAIFTHLKKSQRMRHHNNFLILNEDDKRFTLKVFSTALEPEMSERKRVFVAMRSINLSMAIYNLREARKTGRLDLNLPSDVVLTLHNFTKKYPQSKSVLTEDFRRDMKALDEDAVKALRATNARLKRELEILRALLK